MKRAAGRCFYRFPTPGTLGFDEKHNHSRLPTTFLILRNGGSDFMFVCHDLCCWGRFVNQVSQNKNYFNFSIRAFTSLRAPSIWLFTSFASASVFGIATSVNSALDSSSCLMATFKSACRTSMSSSFSVMSSRTLIKLVNSVGGKVE